ncbi:MAG: DNA mismatch repair protein MutS, partial [Clostridia bacterium]
ISEIDARLSAVATLVEDSYTRNELREELRKVLDIERIATRVSCGSASPRDLKSMEQALRALPRIREILSELENPALRVVYDKIDELTDIFVLIENAITDEPPAITREGGMIKAGYNEEIDKLHGIMSGGNDFLAKIETAEREKTGIKNLKIGYNRVFGYYIEISKSNTAQAPESYVRKQTLANGERYITQELKEMEATILGAKERVIALEIEVYKAVCAEIAAANARVHETSQAIAVLDVLASFATVAVSMGYSRPIITDGNKLIIEDGRHPVVELMLRDAQFVPNDTAMDCGDDRMAVITGPNMAGKSTYMRQVALIVLMAQIGSFVPARYAEIGLVDKIFTRIGASDDLASGQSTFMVEMSEVADIIKNATSKSLILLDEIGRGTSTFDGMAIARAVVEYVANKERIGAKTLFATHYHELTELEGQVSGVKNYNIAAKKHGFD